MVQVALSILKPAGSVGATVQLAIAPPELLKVMFVMALKADGSIKVWGDPNAGGSGAPSGSGYTKIYSTASSPLKKS
jgi:hypothetical protein